MPISISLLVESGMFVGALLATYEGARRIAKFGLMRASLLLLVGGLLVLATDGAARIFWASKLESWGRAVLPHKTFEQPKTWSAEAQPIEMERRNRIIAVINYGATGKLGHYVDRSGGETLLVPTQRELQEREISILANQKMNMSSLELQDLGNSLLAGALAAAAIGCCVGRLQRRKTLVRQ